MDEFRFWAIIQEGGPYDLDDQPRQLASVRRRLLGLPAVQVFHFHNLLFERVINAETWDLWGAASLINGGCSEEDFVYFRAWLIAQGRPIYTVVRRGEPGSSRGYHQARPRIQV